MKIALMQVHLKTGGVTTAIRQQPVCLNGGMDALMISGKPAPHDFIAETLHIPAIAGLLKQPPQKLTDELTVAILKCQRQLWADDIDYPEIEIRSIWQPLIKRPDVERARRFALEYELPINPVPQLPGMITIKEQRRK